MTSAASEAVRSWYLPPSWLALDRGDRLDLLECSGGDRLELTGVLRDALLAGEQPAALQAMALCDATLERFAAALSQHALRPLDRATLLRGSGYGQLFIELTARCNERCVHCYAESSPEREEALDEATLHAVLEDGAALGFARVQLTGGDPLISPLCIPAAQRAHALGFPSIEIYTNGLALSDRVVEQLAPLEVSFAFSFYSANAERHDAITRTPGSQRRTLAAIDRVIAAGLGTRVSIIVMDGNRDDLDATRDLLLAHGVAQDAIGMDVQRSVGRGLMTISPKASGIAGRLGGHKQDSALPFDGRAAVSYDGIVFPCIFSRTFPLGSVHERRLKAIIEDPIPLNLDFDRLAKEQSGRKAQLACWECRARAGLLGSQATEAIPGAMP